MAILHVEKLGGLVGFGGARAHVRSRGQVDTDTLSPADLKAVDALFKAGGKATPRKGADAFRFRIMRATAAGNESVEVHEDQLPDALASCVRDEII